MSSKPMMRCLALAAALMVLACSDAASPSGPTDSSVPGSSATGNPSQPSDTTVSDTTGAGNPTEPSDTSVQVPSDTGASAHLSHEVLKQQLEERKAYFKAQRDGNKEAFTAAKAEWKAWKEDYEEQRKLLTEAWKRDHPGEKGAPEIQLLRCEPQDYNGDAAIIGPNGGSLHVGDHELVIPKGALDHEELIVAEAPTSSLVDVRFAPHGLQFRKSAELKLSYKRCVVPTDSDFFVAYLGQGNQVLELPPSHDEKFDGIVDADIDHFSRYAVAW